MTEDFDNPKTTFADKFSDISGTGKKKRKVDDTYIFNNLRSGSVSEEEPEKKHTSKKRKDPEKTGRSKKTKTPPISIDPKSPSSPKEENTLPEKREEEKDCTPSAEKSDAQPQKEDNSNVVAIQLDTIQKILLQQKQLLVGIDSQQQKLAAQQKEFIVVSTQGQIGASGLLTATSTTWANIFSGWKKEDRCRVLASLCKYISEQNESIK